MRGRGLLLAACAAAAAWSSVSCSGNTGVLSVSLTTAPGSTLLDGAQTLRVTITHPLTVSEAARGSAGFDLVVDFDAIDESGSIIVEGLDASGSAIAVGESPPFPLAAITADVVIYMAAPRSFGAAPLALDEARTGIAVAPLAYGGIFAGGRDGAGATTDEVHIYNAYDHTFAAGVMLFATRSDMAAATGASGMIYFFGGDDGLGSATGTLWQYDPTVSPAGAIADLGTQAAFARTGQALLGDGIEHFIVSGAPPLEIADASGSATVTARTDLLAAPATGATVVGSDGVQTVIFAGSDGCERLRDDAVDPLAVAGAARTGHAMVALADGRIAIVGGALAGTPSTPTLDAVIIDAAAGTAKPVTGALSVARLGAAIAATARYIVVAGGTDGSGAVLQSADLLDPTTLALLATVPMVVARTGAVALALPNEQVLVVGGVDGSGAPSNLIELFTPEAPPE